MVEQLSLPGLEPGGPQPPRPRAKPAARPPRKPFNLFFALHPAPADAVTLVATKTCLTCCPVEMMGWLLCISSGRRWASPWRTRFAISR